MKKIILWVLLPFICISCNSDDTLSNEGSVFQITNFIIESTIDINGDGIFSNDLVEEGSTCFENFGFFENNTVSGISNTLPAVSVSFVDEGNPVQIAGCIFSQIVPPTYSQEGNTVFVGFEGELLYTGTFSDDGNTLTFSIPNQLLVGFLLSENDILREDGSVENYEGGATIVYNRIR